MKIIMTPEDIVKRCLWDSYVYYVLSSAKEGERLLIENEEIEISEKDAFVMGLLKVMETENLIHRFNMNVAEFIINKSSVDKTDDDKQIIILRKRALDHMVEKYLDKFPDYWTPDKMYSSNLKDLVGHVEKFKENLTGLKIYTTEVQNFVNDYYYVKAIKKLLKFNY
jgi:hypothetical protein